MGCDQVIYYNTYMFEFRSDGEKVTISKRKSREAAKGHNKQGRVKIDGMERPNKASRTKPIDHISIMFPHFSSLVQCKFC